MKNPAPALLAVLCMALAAPPTAQAAGGEGMNVDQGVPAFDPTPGEVRKVDRQAGKVTLRHGEIRNLDMPPMTMVFGVRDKAKLDALKAGDKVKFRAVDEGGKLTITEIDVVK